MFPTALGTAVPPSAGKGNHLLGEPLSQHAMAPRPRTKYHIETTLRVPLKFAFRWCTDFRPDDAAREGETYERKILTRTARRVVYEDLELTPSGWYWARHNVRLLPPNRWHSESIGNYREASLDYRLTPLGPKRTRFELTWRRRVLPLAGTPPSRTSIEKGTLLAWRKFAKAMEADYRKTRRR